LEFISTLPVSPDLLRSNPWRSCLLLLRSWFEDLPSSPVHPKSCSNLPIIEKDMIGFVAHVNPRSKPLADLTTASSISLLAVSITSDCLACTAAVREEMYSCLVVSIRPLTCWSCSGVRGEFSVAIFAVPREKYLRRPLYIFVLDW